MPHETLPRERNPGTADDGFTGKDQFIKLLAAQGFYKCPEACFVLFRASF